MAKSQQNRVYHSEEEWLGHKEHIEQLYVFERRTLTQTMDLMRVRYDFVASERCYKKRLNSWNMRKHSRRRAAAGVSAHDPEGDELLAPSNSTQFTAVSGIADRYNVEQTLGLPFRSPRDTIPSFDTNIDPFSFPFSPARQQREDAQRSISTNEYTPSQWTQAQYPIPTPSHYPKEDIMQSQREHPGRPAMPPHPPLPWNHGPPVSSSTGLTTQQYGVAPAFSPYYHFSAVTFPDSIATHPSMSFDQANSSEYSDDPFVYLPTDAQYGTYARDRESRYR